MISSFLHDLLTHFFVAVAAIAITSIVMSLRAALNRQPEKDMSDYSTRLRARGFKPVVIERTEKQPGHVVLHNSVKPAEVIRGGRAA